MAGQLGLVPGSAQDFDIVRLCGRTKRLRSMTPRIVAKASCQNGSKVLTALASYPCIALRRTTTI
jgi:hypothetical protein